MTEKYKKYKKSEYIYKGKTLIEESIDPTILNLDSYLDRYLTFSEKLKNRFNEEYYTNFKREEYAK